MCRAKLLARFESFVVGEWTSLIKASALNFDRAGVARNKGDALTRKETSGQ